MARILTVTLPWPPSVNDYYGNRRGGRGKYLKPKGRSYRMQAAVKFASLGWPRLAPPVRVALILTPPDRRTRDADNIKKALFDALSDRPGHRGILPGDSRKEIDSGAWSWTDPQAPGFVTVTLEEVPR